MSSIIKVNNLTKSFEKVILDSINFEIKRNEYFSIVGKSGSGKTTLINILGLIDNQYDGDLFFHGKIVLKGKDHYSIRKKYIGYIFQNYKLIENISAYDNIVLPFIFSHSNYNSNFLSSLISMLEIKELLNKTVGLLSGGEKQRVAIARALLIQPELIIADEPTGNLDQENEMIVMKVLKNLHQEGHSIILITHSQSLAIQAQKQYLLENGKLYVQ